MKQEHAIGFLQFIIDNYCIGGINTFFHPDNIELDLTAEQVYKEYLKSNHKSV